MNDNNKNLVYIANDHPVLNKQLCLKSSRVQQWRLTEEEKWDCFNKKIKSHQIQAPSLPSEFTRVIAKYASEKKNIIIMVFQVPSWSFFFSLVHF